MSVEEFRIATPQADVIDLKERLSRTRWPSEIPNAGWSQGTNLAYLHELVAYWKTQFDWRQQESRLNQFSHFRADVEGLKLHFLHAKGGGPHPLPLVLIHGWPSSFAEMLKVIPLLTDPGSHGGDPHDSFDVVVPSLPGYGYSEAPRESGMSIWRAADLIHQLMRDVLGYSTYVVSGGDWGAYAATHLGCHHAQQIPAIHLSFVPGGIAPATSSTKLPLSQAESDLLAHRQKWAQHEDGYEHLQSTKPQTIAFALTDSPVGLAAWILIGRVGVASTNNLTNANLDSITAVVIGGTSLFGGRGAVLGTLFGALIVQVFQSGINLAGVQSLYQVLAEGILVIVAVALDQWIRKVRR